MTEVVPFQGFCLSGRGVGGGQSPFGWGLDGQAVENIFAGTPIFYQSRLAQLGEMGGEGALAHGEDLLQLGDRELLSVQKQKNTEAVGVGDDAEDFYYGGH